jgi:hypothetical protein
MGHAYPQNVPFQKALLIWLKLQKLLVRYKFVISKRHTKLLLSDGKSLK